MKSKLSLKCTDEVHYEALMHRTSVYRRIDLLRQQCVQTRQNGNITNNMNTIAAIVTDTTITAALLCGYCAMPVVAGRMVVVSPGAV